LGKDPEDQTESEYYVRKLINLPASAQYSELDGFGETLIWQENDRTFYWDYKDKVRKEYLLPPQIEITPLTLSDQERERIFFNGAVMGSADIEGQVFTIDIDGTSVPYKRSQRPI